MILDIIDKLKNFKRENTLSNYNTINSFRNKINKLISTTPTGELRNELTDISILFENLNSNYENQLQIIKNI